MIVCIHYYYLIVEGNENWLNMTEDEMVWDLSQIVKDTDFASIQQNLESMIVEAKKFERPIIIKSVPLMRKGS